MTTEPTPPRVHWEDELPSHIKMERDKLIDKAYGRKVAKFFLSDLWEFYMWVERCWGEMSDSYILEKDEKQYDDIAIDTSLRCPDGFSDKNRINAKFFKLDDKSMIKTEFYKPKEINDVLRAKYARDFIDEVNRVQQNYIFSVKIKNKNNEAAHIGGISQCGLGGRTKVNWIIGAYKTKDEFKKCFEPYDLNRLSDEEILKRYFNKNGK